jgi:hypothetical protein
LDEESEQVEVATTAIFGVTETRSASKVFLAQLPPSYSDDFHPPPVRYLVDFLRGAIETSVTDGSMRTFSAGDVVLLDHGDSRGHKSAVIGESGAELLLVELAE